MDGVTLVVVVVGEVDDEDEEEWVSEDGLEEDDERGFSGSIPSLAGVTVVSRMRLLALVVVVAGIAAVMSTVMESEWERDRGRDWAGEEARAVVLDVEVEEKRGFTCCCWCCCCRRCCCW